VSVVRPIDRWFIEEVLPCEQLLLARAARLCSGTDEARDLVQDVFARMLAMEGWRAVANPQTYMLRMMRNIAIDRMRRAKVIDFRHLADAEESEIADDAPDQHRIFEDREAVQQLGRALDELPERCREVFVRRRIEGQAPRRIAEELGLSLSTLEKRLARAIQLLTAALSPHPGDRCGSHDEPADKNEAARRK
jgi:RNA polymerase sigma factor (sigma-70 family)